MAGPGQPKTGGRVKGTPNKRTAAMRELIDQVAPGWHPVQWMAAIAAGTAETTGPDGKLVKVEADMDQRITCAKEVARYVAPQLKSVEHEHAVREGSGGIMILNAPARDHEEWHARHFTKPAAGSDPETDVDDRTPEGVSRH